VEPDVLVDELGDGCTVLGGEPASTTDCARALTAESENVRIDEAVRQRRRDVRELRRRIIVKRFAGAHIGAESVGDGDMSFFFTS
jgi:hypothetical protein